MPSREDAPHVDVDVGRELGIAPGDVLAGKYRVERVLGVGGMGVVLAAHHLQLDETVALKFLLPQALANPDAVARFVREARAAAKIKSEHVARVNDVATLDDGAPFMVMEYLEGRDLSAWIAESGALPIEQAVDFVLQACDAIADAHALGIVHRDLKPANLFCARRTDGQLTIKVLDFGISKVTRPGSPGFELTRTNSVMGSPLYMSPEQMLGGKGVDAATDIWSLGGILFELLAGRPAFLAESVTELAIKVTNDPAPAIRSLRPEVPVLLQTVVLRCLEKDRARRFANVAELARALLPFAPRRSFVLVERIDRVIRSAGFVVTSPGTTAPAPAAAALTYSPGLAPPGFITGAPLGQTAAPPVAVVQSPRGTVVALAVAAVAVCGVAGLVRMRGTASSSASAATVFSDEPAASTAAAVAAPASAPLPSVAWNAAEAGAGQPAEAPSATRATPRGGSTHATPAKPRPPAAATPPSSKECDPPYTLDDQGNRHYKPQCYLNK